MPDAPGVSASTAATMPAVRDSRGGHGQPAADGAGDGLAGDAVQIACDWVGSVMPVPSWICCFSARMPLARSLSGLDDVFDAGPDA